MPLTLVSPLASRERILFYGGPGCGKSTAVLQLARKLPHSRFTVLELGDVSYDRLQDTEFADVRAQGNVAAERVWDWTDLLARFGDTAKTMARDDWCVCDLGGEAWKMVQDWFSEQVHGVDIADYAVEVRKAKGGDAKSLELLDGWMDWSVINPQYRKLVKALLMANGHVIWTAAADKYAEGADKAVNDLYTRIGYKPVGQKHMGFNFNTVLLFDKMGRGTQVQWQITTVKDRGRVELDRFAWQDFATQYLMQVAGWRVGQVG